MSAAAPLDADTAAAAAPAVVVFASFASLPPVLAHKIFAALPVDTRLRCAEVCTAWCAAVAERSLWTRLDFSETSGVAHRHGVTSSLVRAAISKSRGALTALDVSGVYRLFREDEALSTALAANVGVLRELRCLRGPLFTFMPVSELEALLSAAPQLRVCEADVLLDDAEEARRALRNEGVFGPLRVRACFLTNPLEAQLVSMFASVAAHASLTELHLEVVPLHNPAALDAFVDAALSLPLLRTVELGVMDGFSPASAPALARLLGSGTLTELALYDDGEAFLDVPAAVLLGDALRANATLTSLTLFRVNLSGVSANPAVADALLSALRGHTSLQELCIIAHELKYEQEDQLHAGMLLGTLVAADAPALTALDVSCCYVSDAGMRPLFEALPGNSHLRQLKCSGNGITDEFARDVLLPAVRANTSLRTLVTHEIYEQPLDAAREAEALVKSRG
jgi:hypothetical protein